MESQPQNPEFRNNPENFHLCIICQKICKEMSQTTCRLHSSQFKVIDTNMPSAIKCKKTVGIDTSNHNRYK